MKIDSWLKQLITQFLKFNLVGVINTLLTYLVFVFVMALFHSRNIALSCDYVFGFLFSFFANKIFTFRVKQTNWEMFLKMGGTYFALFWVNLGLLAVLVDYMKINIYIAQFFTIALIAGSSFVLQRFFVFVKHINES